MKLNFTEKEYNSITDLLLIQVYFYGGTLALISMNLKRVYGKKWIRK